MLLGRGVVPEPSLLSIAASLHADTLLYHLLEFDVYANDVDALVAAQKVVQDDPRGRDVLDMLQQVSWASWPRL